MKSVGISFLSKTTLSNLNAGQGNSNLVELKLYDGEQKPYVSGQSIRRALFDSIERSNPEKFKCVPESACGDVEHCWSCDLRGYLSVEEGVGGTRRWSPIKVTPALGQLSNQIVNDMLTRHSVLKKENKNVNDNRIAHTQMMENIYLVGLSIDVENIGYVKVPKVEKKGKKETFVGWETAIKISEEERRFRIRELFKGLYNLSGFAKQARSATSLAPDIILFTLRETFNQRGLDILELNEDKSIKNIDRLNQYIKDEKAFGSELIFGYTSGVIENETKLLEVMKGHDIVIQTVGEAFSQIIKGFE